MHTLKQPINQEVVLVTRYGGLGDLVMLLPTLKYLRLRHPQAKFVLRTYRDYVGYIDAFFDQVILDDNRFLTYQDRSCLQQTAHGPVVATLQHDLTFASQGDELFHYNFHGVIERNQHLHGVCSFAEFSGLKLGFDIIPSIPNSREVTSKRVIQIRSAGGGRDLVKSDLPCHVLDDPNVCLVDRLLSPQDYMDMIGSAAEFIGPDSSGLHLAVALGVPNITGLYTKEFPPAIRAYPGVRAFIDRDEFFRSI